MDPEEQLRWLLPLGGAGPVPERQHAGHTLHGGRLQDGPCLLEQEAGRWGGDGAQRGCVQWQSRGGDERPPVLAPCSLRQCPAGKGLFARPIVYQTLFLSLSLSLLASVRRHDAMTGSRLQSARPFTAVRQGISSVLAPGRGTKRRVVFAPSRTLEPGRSRTNSLQLHPMQSSNRLEIRAAASPRAIWRARSGRPATARSRAP